MKFFDGPILGIETSCDDTSAAILRGDSPIASVISSQDHLLERWGGVVPEAAARAHVESIVPVLTEVCERANVRLDELSGVAVTNRPGLIGSLSVGVTAGKTIAAAHGIPLIGVHHIEGHLLSSWFCDPKPAFPHLSLVASGGHTELVWIEEPGVYEILGETLDDAAGEAFDKGARVMGLGFPGGRAIQEHASRGNAKAYSLPISRTAKKLDFSFSGIKTATLRLVEKHGDTLCVEDAAATLQHAIVESLALRVEAALQERKPATLTLVGGVAANIAVRKRLEGIASRHGTQFACPEFAYCTDNAAMIALVGSWRLASGERADFSLDCIAAASLDELR